LIFTFLSNDYSGQVTIQITYIRQIQIIISGIFFYVLSNSAILTHTLSSSVLVKSPPRMTTQQIKKDQA